jgi:hypothetical protein
LICLLLDVVAEGRLDCGLSEGDMLLISLPLPNCPRNNTRSKDATKDADTKLVMHFVPFEANLFLLSLEYKLEFVVLEFSIEFSAEFMLSMMPLIVS